MNHQLGQAQQGAPEPSLSAPLTSPHADLATLVRPGHITPGDPAQHIDLANATEVSPGMRLDNTLILMACSQTKKAMPTGWDAVPLIDLYDGPMWRSLRTHLGCAYQPAQAFEAQRHIHHVVVLSGKFGITSASVQHSPYEGRLSTQRADELIRRGLLGEAGRGLAMTPLSYMACPYAAVPQRRRPWQGVIIGAGGDYRRVFMALLRQLQQCGHLASDVAILATRGGIGAQRSQLGRWVAHLVRAQQSQSAPHDSAGSLA